MASQGGVASDDGSVRRWWAARSLRLRVTLVATTVLALGLACGTAALALLFFHQRVAAVDENNHAEVRTLHALARTGQLPDPLPEPAGQPLMAQVVDQRGVVRASTSSSSRVVPILPVGSLQQHADRGSFTTSATQLGTGQSRVLVEAGRLRGSPVYVVSAVSFNDVRDTLGALLKVIAVAVPVVLLAAGIATWLAVGSALRPVDEMSVAAERVARSSSRSTPQLPVPPSRDELARLAVTLNRMLERLSEAAAQQRSFVADAAHELRSPIAAIRAQLEVTQVAPVGPTEWEDVVADALVDVERLERLANDMLLLARLDSGASSAPTTVDVDELVGLPSSGRTVEGDRAALWRACDNLISNGQRHARHDVTVSVESDAREVRVVVDDDGAGIPPEDRERVFERWVRLDEARTRDEGGAGLGLAIARSVARSHGGDVTLHDSPLGGVRAVLSLPASTAAG